MEEDDSLHEGQVEVRQLIFGYVDSMTIKCAVELEIPDIIHKHGKPISLSQIASGIGSAGLDHGYLKRIMRYLVRKQVFSVQLGEEEDVYGLTHISKWLVSSSDLCASPIAIFQSHPLQLAPWHYLAQTVKEGGLAFNKAHGCGIWDLASKNQEFNKMFNDAMACSSKLVIQALLDEYKTGFGPVKTLVDVGGGIGQVLSEIVKAFPHINGVNFDLPHVVATAPEYAGISHVGGDMFQAIPKADAIFMKSILHDWNDEECVKILNNCREALSEKRGKLILVEIVVVEEERSGFGNVDVIMDLIMMAQTSGGERTDLAWKKLLENGGFKRFKIIRIPSLLSIIEAYLE